MTRQFPNSTTIDSVTYEPILQQLVVKFKGNNKATYTYKGIPWDLADRIQNLPESESAGRWVNANIVRSNYKFEKTV